MKKSKRNRLAIVVVPVAVVALSCLVACSSQMPQSQDSQNQAAAEGEPILEAAEWSDSFPDQYRSWVDTVNQDYAHTPDVEGKAESHMTCIEPPEGYAFPFMPACLACHSTQVLELTGKYGDEFCEQDASTIADETHMGIACYTCHGNTPGEMNPQNSWIVEAAEKGGVETSDGNMVCAQCHAPSDLEHMFDNSDTSTWSLLQGGIDPEQLWEYLYAEDDQEPILPASEIVLNNYIGSTHDMAGTECADCHMEKATNEAGQEYTVHSWTSVRTNENLYNNCLKCHEGTVDDRKAALEKVQAEFLTEKEAAQARIDSLSETIESSKEKSAPEAIEKATVLRNKAQFFVNYRSEQSDGLHAMGEGSATAKCFDLAGSAVDEALGLLA